MVVKISDERVRRKHSSLRNGVEGNSEKAHNSAMSKVQQLEAEMEKLSPSELQQIRDWLDDILEDQLRFTDEFEAQIKQSEQEVASGERPRTRRP
jgi:archaellum component FlaC